MLRIEDYKQYILKGKPLEMDKEVEAKIQESHDFLAQHAKEQLTYGINTGFGPMAQHYIEPKLQAELQYNLIRSHASGTGPGLKDDEVKALMISRLNTLSLGYSGVSLNLIKQLQAFINLEIFPYIPEHGSVGASGDLVQLAHLAYALIGEGEVRFKGVATTAKEALESCGLKPLKLALRDGLSMINGTSVMSGIGMVNAIKGQRLMDLAIIYGAMLNEMVDSFDDHFSKELNESKQHQGQRDVAAKMRFWLEGSKKIKRRADYFKSVDGFEGDKVYRKKVQEYYSLRCIPQILGPVLDTLKNTTFVLENEVNSANDNPIVDLETQMVYHGGNFHGDYIALEMDKLKIGVTRIAMLLERQLNYLMNPKLNEQFPPFLNAGKLGFNFGVQGMQFTAVSTTAENQTLANPMYVHSIPNNNDNQDIVSMGTNAALLCRKVIDNAYEVLSVAMISLVQAYHLCEKQDQFSAKTKGFMETLAKDFPIIKEDVSFAPIINKMNQKLQEIDFNI